MNSIKYIPKKLQEHQLYTQVTELIDKVIADNQQYFDDIAYKHKDYSKVSPDAIEATIDEYGYDYLLDIMKLTETEPEDLINFLALIHYLKGNKKGLELVLRLLNVSFTVEEWWEQLPLGEPMTYDLTVNVNFTSTSVMQTLRVFRTFLESYVYPKVILSLIFQATIADMDTHFGGVIDTIHTGTFLELP